MRVRTGKLRISAQNSFYTVPGVHVPGDVCTISGTYIYDLGQSPVLQTTWDLYTTKTQNEIEDRLRSVFLPVCGFGINTRGTLILDMEGGPVDGHNSHPNHLYLETDSDKALIITAWKRRIAAVRAVFPYARIGVYATPRISNLGDGDADLYVARVGALVQAGTTAGYNSVGSAWDGVDLLIPICYQIWGPNDTAQRWGSNEARVVEAMTGAALIKKSTGASIPAMPLISTYCSGSQSEDDGVLMTELDTADPLGETWGVAFDVFKDYGIDEVCCWNGQNSRFARDGNGLTTTLLSALIHAGRGWG